MSKERRTLSRARSLVMLFFSGTYQFISIPTEAERFSSAFSISWGWGDKNEAQSSTRERIPEKPRNSGFQIVSLKDCTLGIKVN